MKYFRRGTRRSSSLVRKRKRKILMLSVLLIKSLHRESQPPMAKNPPPHCLL